jgi:amino-acid N-acetyltransferase
MTQSAPTAAAVRAVHPARAGDLADVLSLLRASGLPVDGVEARFPAGFVVGREVDGALAGVAGVEVYGDSGLLRSVAVRADLRGTGLGQALSAAAVEAARTAGVRDLFLLTTTAEKFFLRLGFEPWGRGDVPAALAASEELRGACPAAAVVMRRRLA